MASLLYSKYVPQRLKIEPCVYRYVVTFKIKLKNINARVICSNDEPLKENSALNF